MGLRRMKFRGTVFVGEQVLLTAAAQNIKRMARILSSRGPKNSEQGAETSICPLPELCGLSLTPLAALLDQSSTRSIRYLSFSTAC